LLWIRCESGESGTRARHARVLQHMETKVAIERRALVVVAGLPGSGKSTLLRDVCSNAPVTVVDSDHDRAWLAARLPKNTPYARYRPLVHTLHRLRIAALAASSPGPIAVHAPATGLGTRLTLVAIGVLTRRPRHQLWVDCTPEEALAGQIERGRIVPTKSFAKHVSRAPRLRAKLGTGPPRGWQSARVVERGDALSLGS
jgi:energy-coupling factor transporter ATP-binding protein EcfA2